MLVGRSSGRGGQHHLVDQALIDLVTNGATGLALTKE